MSGFKLKLKVPGASSEGLHQSASVVSNGTPSTPAPPSAVTPGGSKKPMLKFRSSGSQPPTPAPAVVEDLKPKKTKAGRATKPSAKLIESKKRVKEESESENEGSTIAVVAPDRPSKKIKLISHATHSLAQAAGPKTPVVLKAKVKGKPPKRPLGEGYDSEASDREEDPFIEEEFILRMMPGEDCDYLRTAIADKKIGLPKHQGGPDISMKFFHQDGRRAAITIRGHCYAATLVDLPCVIEGMKSWDRRGWLKSADICQMLWVFAPIKKEDDAKTIALPKIIDQETFQYPHGLTPPMHFARKRRFRKRISRTAIEKVEAEVEKLLEEDAKAAATRFEMVEPDNKSNRAFSPRSSEAGNEFSEDEDAEGEADDTGYFNTQHTNETSALPNDAEADLEADFEAAMLEESLAAETPSSAVGATPSMLIGGETPMVEEVIEDEEDDSGDESLEDDDGDDENPVTTEADNGEKARMAHIQSVKEDIADLERKIEESHRQLASANSNIIKGRLEGKIRNMKAELQLKISSLGEGEDDD